jgi:hypothetical protein
MKPGRIYETIAVLRGPGILYITPLGLAPAPHGALTARIYPGTRLREVAEEAYEACIGLTLEPQAYIDALTSPALLPLRPARAVSAPCPALPARIEAVIVARSREDETLHLLLEPVHVEAERTLPAYTRALGCTIEALVAATRVNYWSRQIPPKCGTASAQYRALKSALECASRGAPGDHGLLERLRSLLDSAAGYMAVHGCPPPEPINN